MSRSSFNGLRTNPATRIGRYLLFPGGHVVRLSRWQQALYAFGGKRTVEL